jgi:hypothetical protein
MPSTSKVVVLGYSCQYQEGFLYSVDDTTNNGMTATCISPPCAGSIGDNVASLTDQVVPYTNNSLPTVGIIWSANGNGNTQTNLTYDFIPSISNSQTSDDSYTQAKTAFNTTYSNSTIYPFPLLSAFANCDGACQSAYNSNNILALYDAYKTNHAFDANLPYTLSKGLTSRTNYAAGLWHGTHQ